MIYKIPRKKKKRNKKDAVKLNSDGKRQETLE